MTLAYLLLRFGAFFRRQKSHAQGCQRIKVVLNLYLWRPFKHNSCESHLLLQEVEEKVGHTEVSGAVFLQSSSTLALNTDEIAAHVLSATTELVKLYSETLKGLDTIHI